MSLAILSATLIEDLHYTLQKLSGEERKKLENASLLITGCAGFLGYYLVHFFHEHADELKLKKVICLDNFMLGYPKWIGARPKTAGLPYINSI